MGVGYSAASLHRINYLEPVEGTMRREPPVFLVPLMKKNGAVWDGRSTRFRSDAVADIVTWRAALNDKYSSQLGEELTWDEASGFEQSEDAATSADMLLRYVAAVLDQHRVRRAPGPGRKDNAAQPSPRCRVRRGWTQRICRPFPPTPVRGDILVPLPTASHHGRTELAGNVERYGSLLQLSEAIKELRDRIIDVDASVTVWTADKAVPEHDAVDAAWQASDTVSRLCAAAVARHLPLWTTG